MEKILKKQNGLNIQVKIALLFGRIAGCRDAD